MIKSDIPNYMKLPAESNPRGPQEIRVLAPSKGLNQLGDAFMIDNKEASDLLNVMFTQNGIVEKRYGYSTIASPLENIPKGLTLYKGTERNLVCVDGTKVKKLINGVWNNISDSKEVSGSNVTLTSCRKKLFVWDGVGQSNGGCLIYDDSRTDGNVYVGTKCPKGKFSVSYKQRQVTAGVDGQPYRLFFSKIASPDIFTITDKVESTTTAPLPNNANDVPGATVFEDEQNETAAFCQDVNPEDGEMITGLGFFQDALIIFKEHSIWQAVWTTSNSGSELAVSRITNAYGCISHGSICTVENDCFFLSNDGIYVLGNEPNYYTAIRTNQLSARVVGVINRINFNAKQGIRSIFNDNKYYLLLPLDGYDYNNYMLIYDKRFYAWTLWDVPASGIATYDDELGKQHVAFTSSVSNKTCQFVEFQYNDDGEPINAYWRSRAFHGQKIDYVKLWKVVRPIFKRLQSRINITYSDENGEFDVEDKYQISKVQRGGLGIDFIGGDTLGLSNAGYFYIDDNGNLVFDDGTEESHKNNNNNSIILNIFVGHESRTFDIKISNNNVNENFSLLGFIIQYETKDFSVFNGEDTYLTDNSGVI